MSRLNVIQQKFSEIESGLFQKVCDAYLTKKKVWKITSRGSQLGTNKTTKGTPDAFSQLENGEYAFIEYTTQTKGLLGKILDDIDKCYDELLTGIDPSLVSQIAYCHIAKLDPGELDEIYTKCKTLGCSYEDFDAGAIAFDLAYTFPHIAFDLLDVPFQTGQIVQIDRLQHDTSMVTSLLNEFVGRKSELEGLQDKLLAQDLVIVTGRAGVGKTRIAIEGMRAYAQLHPGTGLFGVRNNGAPIVDDVLFLLSTSESVVLLVDDANRLGQLDFVLSHLRSEGHNLKVILTVRDYALKDVVSRIEGIEHLEQRLEPLSRSQIRDLISSETVGIKHPVFLDRICDVAAGNPRLAMMAAKIVRETDSYESIANTSMIYDNYFQSLSTRLAEMDSAAIRVLAIVGYFQTLNRSRLQTDFYTFFGLDESQFWELIQTLYSLELVDIYDNQLCKVSDQIVGTYFFNMVYIVERQLDIAVIFENFFHPQYLSRMTEALVTASRIFDLAAVKRVCSEPARRFWLGTLATQRPDEILAIAEVIWFLIPDEVLAFLKTLISSLEAHIVPLKFESNVHGITDKIFFLLGHLCNLGGDHEVIALELAVEYLGKRNDLASQFAQFVERTYAFDTSISLYTAERQMRLFSLLKPLALKNPLLQRAVVFCAPHFLKLSHEQSMQEGRNVTFTQYTLPFLQHIKVLHSQILSDIGEPHMGEHFVRFVSLYTKAHSYFRNENKEQYRAALHFDSDKILNTTLSAVDLSSFNNCKIVSDYLSLLRLEEIESQEAAELEAKISVQPAYRTFRAVVFDHSDRRSLLLSGVASENIEEIREKALKKFVDGLDLRGILEVFQYFQEYRQSVEEQSTYVIRNSLNQFVDMVLSSGRYVEELLINIIKNGNAIDYELGYSIQKALDFYSGREDRLYDLISRGDYNLKSTWIVSFFQRLPESLISRKVCRDLRRLYARASFPYEQHWDFLLKYDQVFPGTFVAVVRSYFRRRRVVRASFQLMFNPYTEVYKRHKFLFKTHLGLLKKIWLYETTAHGINDYDGAVIQTIFEKDRLVLESLFAAITQKQRYPSADQITVNLDFVWLSPSAFLVVDRLANWVLKAEKYIMDNTLFCAAFSRRDGISGEEIRAKQEDYFRYFIGKYSNSPKHIDLIFRAIKVCCWDRIPLYVKLYASTSPSIKDFSALKLEYTIFSGGSTFIPVYSKMLSMWESIHAELASSDYLEYRLHANDKVEYWRRSIAAEREKQFLSGLFED